MRGCSFARQCSADGADQTGTQQPVAKAAVGAQGDRLRLLAGDGETGVAEFGELGGAAHVTREREQGLARQRHRSGTDQGSSEQKHRGEGNARSEERRVGKGGGNTGGYGWWPYH